MKRYSVIIAVLIMTVIITGCVKITVSPKKTSDTVYGGEMTESRQGTSPVPQKETPVCFW